MDIIKMIITFQQNMCFMFIALREISSSKQWQKVPFAQKNQTK